ncbi:hypothetical protein LC040_05060 [Bacillus tianshenii]|nr:hypothetical protein LC040_05060 [Bacillus tianshenii]
MKRLAILPCGAAKIWDKYPNLGPQQAKDVYSSSFHQTTRAYAEQFIGEWVILSAKHGFLFPDDTISENYNVSFSMSKANIISDEQLQRQISEKGLAQYDQLVVLGGKKYHRVVERNFSNIDFCYPLKGCKGIGYMLQRMKNAMKNHSEIQC